jgi:hypothetical protein
VQHHAFQIVPHVGCRDSDGAHALLGYPAVPALVALWVVAEFMRKAKPASWQKKSRM